MRIGLNLLAVRPGTGGSWNYIHALITALAEYDRDNEYVLFVTDASAVMVPSQSNFRAIKLAVPSAWRTMRVLYENTVFRFVVRAQQLDCLHHVFGTLPFVGRIASVVTIYDLMELDRPDEVAFVKRAYLRVMRGRAARRATILAPISRATADHLQRTFDVDGDRMEVIPAAIEDRFTPLPREAVEAFRRSYALGPAFWLVVADDQPHKNYKSLIAAFAQLRRDRPNGWPLAIRGEPSRDLLALVQEHGVGGIVTFVPRLSVEEMPLLYGAASALVFPSYFEGGGMPVMEAMACGCPVVASNIPTTAEFARDAAMTFDPTDVDSISRVMRACEDSPDQRAVQITRGLEAVSTLRPDAVARVCVTVYARIEGIRPS